MGIMVTHRGYNGEYNNPTYDAHKNMGAHYTWQNMVTKVFFKGFQQGNASVVYQFLFLK